MEIKFDASDVAACQTALAVILYLHPNLSNDSADEAVPNDASPAPVSEGAITPTPADAGSLDKDGIPWDNRIHSTPPTLTGKGVWRAKRNVDESFKATVEAELRQAMGASVAAPTTAPSAPPPTPEPAAMAFGQDVATTAADVPPPPPVAPPPPPPVAAHDPLGAAAADGWQAHPQAPGYWYKGQDVTLEADVAAKYPAPTAALTFDGLMRRIVSMQTAGTLTAEATMAIAQGMGLTGVRDLLNRPDLIPTFDSQLPVSA